MPRIPTTLALTSLALILASCGGPSIPQAQTQLVSMHLIGPGGLNGQGLTGDAPARTLTVKVRNSSNQLVAFNGTTFDPTGNGATTLTLDSSNQFRKTLVLPAGTYTFENAVKDDATGTTLLAYGPAAENSAAISGDNAVVRLKSHGVFNPASSRLDSSMDMPQLFTNSTFNLALNLKTSPVNGTSATVPTTDIGGVTYSLGNATDGVLNNTGSKMGVSVTARGTDMDSILNVTGSFNAWIRNAGTDTASYGPTSLTFAKAIQTNAVVTDTTAPMVTFAPVTSAYQNTVVNLSGTATDEVQVGEIRVYADMQLVASTVSGDGVNAIKTDGSGNWNTTWTPGALKDHEVSVVVSDTSGNETRASQSVTVTAAPVANFDQTLNYAAYGDYDYRDYTVAANSETWVKVETNGWTGNNYAYFYLFNGSTSGTSATFGPTQASQTPMIDNGGGHRYSNNVTSSNGVYYLHLINTNSYPVDIQVHGQRN